MIKDFFQDISHSFACDLPVQLPVISASRSEAEFMISQGLGNQIEDDISISLSCANFW